MTSSDVTIRQARPADAERLIAYVQTLAEEPGINIVIGPGEFDLTVGQEACFVAECVAADNALFLVAEAGSEIVGLLTCQGGKRRATRHAATLGVSVAQGWRGQGIGTRLMEWAIRWARGTGIVSRIELMVFARNQKAIRLYERLGFVEEGRLRKAIYRDGEYIDDLVMGLLL